MTLPKISSLQSAAFEEIQKIWEKTIKGGVIACTTPSKAVSLRHRMYRYRRLLQKAYKITPYDDMIIKLERGDNRLFVMKRDEGVIDILPLDYSVEEAKDDSGSDIIIARNDAKKDDSWKNEDIV